MQPNKNYLSSSKFHVSLERIPELGAYVKSINIPEISVPAKPMATPFADVKVPGDTLTFGAIDITFGVDEDLSQYMALQNWLREIAPPDKKNSTNFEINELCCDLTVTLLTNNSNPNYNIRFVDVVPISLSQLPLTYQQPIDIECSITLEYDYYYIEKVA